MGGAVNPKEQIQAFRSFWAPYLGECGAIAETRLGNWGGLIGAERLIEAEMSARGETNAPAAPKIANGMMEVPPPALPLFIAFGKLQYCRKRRGARLLRLAARYARRFSAWQYNKLFARTA